MPALRPAPSLFRRSLPDSLQSKTQLNAKITPVRDSSSMVKSEVRDDRPNTGIEGSQRDIAEMEDLPIREHTREHTGEPVNSQDTIGTTLEKRKVTSAPEDNAGTGEPVKSKSQSNSGATGEKRKVTSPSEDDAGTTTRHS